VTFRLRKGPPTTTYADVRAALARQGVSQPVGGGRARRGARDPAAQGDGDRRRDPDTRSVGSFFTNPVIDRGDAEGVAGAPGAARRRFRRPDGRVKVPAAWLIERAGFAKGTREGAVGLSSKHTLAIVTRDGATAADVIRFASRVARRVEALFGVRLRPEPVLLGFAGSDVEPDMEYLMGAQD
jgi:UDP-N-acetylmuramate dehydrogenase